MQNNQPPDPQPASAADAQGRHMLAALRHRDFRLLWFGQLVSTIGDQMQMIAISWHIYVLTGSTIALGAIALSRTVPFMLLSIIGGAFADAVERRRLLIVTQSALMAVTVMLVASTIAGFESPWIIYVATFLAGAASAFDAPARQALVPSLVPRDELANALAMNTLLRQTASVFGPGLGGIAIAQLGLGATYGINAVTFLAVLLALMAMQPRPIVGRTQESTWQRLIAGLTYTRREPMLLYPLLLDFVTRLVGSPRSLLPVFVKDIYRVGPEALGWLTASSSVGAVLGGLTLGAIREVRWPIAVMFAAYAIEGASGVGFAASSTIEIGCAMLMLSGMCNVVGEVVRNTIAQLKTPDHLRGRTTALNSMLAQGGPGLGQFEAGVVASQLGPVGTVAFNGVASIAVTALFALLPSMRKNAGKRLEEL